jgi:hypothetical protein
MPPVRQGAIWLMGSTGLILVACEEERQPRLAARIHKRGLGTNDPHVLREPCHGLIMMAIIRGPPFDVEERLKSCGNPPEQERLSGASTG